jgi:dienelactone hydrolase
MRCWGVIALAMMMGCGAASGGDDSGDDTGSPDALPGAAPDAPGGASVDAAGDDGGGAATDPAAPGAWDVHDADASAATELGTAAVTVYSPSSDGGATPAAGPFPLVIVSTGFQIGRGNYEGTCRHLASWGYVVVAHDYTSGNHQEKAAEIGDLIDWAIAQLGARVDGSRIAVAGHSLGGKVSINAAILDARIDAVVGWDPVDALPPFSDGSTSVTPQLMAGLTVPLAVLGETTDSTGGMPCAPSADNYARYFDEACAAPAALEVTITGADHTDWVDDRSACGLACLFCATGATADMTILEITRRVTVAWLEVHLRGDDSFSPYLAAPGAPTTLRSVVPGC